MRDSAQSTTPAVHSLPVRKVLSIHEETVRRLVIWVALYAIPAIVVM
jgi:hypothetical protein